MRKISREELASLIDLGRLREIVANKTENIPLIGTREEAIDTKKVGQIVKVTLIVIAVVAAICGIAYAIYRFVTPNYDDDFDDDFDDVFDDDDVDDLFEDDEKTK